MRHKILLLGLAILILFTPVFAADEDSVKFNAYTGSTFEKNRAIFDVFTQESASACFYIFDNFSIKEISEKINQTRYRVDLKNLTTGKHKILFTCYFNSKNYSTNPYNFEIYPIFCGDGICSSGETPQSCPADCGSPYRKIGDVCYSDESCESKHCVHGFCRENKWAAGDGFCDKNIGENCENSPKDCGVCPKIKYRIYSSTMSVQPFCKEESVCIDVSELNVELIIDNNMSYSINKYSICFNASEGSHIFTLKKEQFLSISDVFNVIECDKKIIFGYLCSKYAWPLVALFALLSAFIVWMLLNPRFFMPKYEKGEGARANLQHFINSALRSLSEEEIVNLAREKGWQISDVASAVKNVVMQRDFKRFLFGGAVFITLILIVFLLGVCDFYWVPAAVCVVSVATLIKQRSLYF